MGRRELLWLVQLSLSLFLSLRLPNFIPRTDSSPALSSALETGVSRLALSALDSSVRSWLQFQSASLFLSTQVDQMGNQFLTRAGTQPSLHPIAMGSHLDTQPAGGRFDGVLGVLAALEVLRTLDENGVVTQHPLTLINWTNEEGARFPKSMLSSGVWAGAIPLETAWGLKEVAGEKTVRQELEAHGWLGPVPASHEATPLAAHFELHIEQGPILERGGKKVGVVKGVQAYRWYSVEIVGREAHTGATPEEDRADALLAASRCYIGCKEIAKNRCGTASVGIMKVGPGSTNTVPGIVRFSLDVRAPKFAQVLGIENDCKELFEEVCREGGGCKVEWTQDFESHGTLFNENCKRAVEKAAVDVVGQDKIKEIISGAGHDRYF
jgi:hydantoinase/carbamoylase family amidase